MRFTSLIVELIRSKPALVLWAAMLAQALLWLIVPMILYAAPPGETATVLAIGREYQLGTQDGPPLAFWLADIAFKVAGNNMFGVYLLSQICFVVTITALFALARAIVGPQQAVIATLLTMTVTAFSFPGVEFGPAVLARPLWALTLLHYWRAVGEGRRNAWFAFSIEAGLLLLTTYAALLPLGLLIVFTVATRRGRAALNSFDPWYALFVIGALILPHGVWLARAGIGRVLVDFPTLAQIHDNLLGWPYLFGAIVLTMAGIALLAILNSARIGPKADDVPVIQRAPVSGFARHFVWFFALAPLILASIVAAALGGQRTMGDGGVLLAVSGLAVVLAAGNILYLRRQKVLRLVWVALVVAPAITVMGFTLTFPWIFGTAVKTTLPAREVGRFFGDNFERRTGMRLPAVAGDAEIATLVALAAPGRPHLLLDATPERTPWTSVQHFVQTGGLVVWQAHDTVGAPPDDLKRRFPDLVAEVPRAFERSVQGRQQLTRIGWAIVRPRAAPR